MNTSIKTILAAIAMGATAIAAQAQTATTVGQSATPRVVTISAGTALNNYYRTAEESAKLNAFEQNAQKAVDGLIAEGKAMADKFKAAQDTFQSPMATQAAKDAAQADAQRIYNDIRAKEQQISDYRQQAYQQIQQGIMQTRQALMIEIANKATEIGKAKGATVILDRDGLVYADPAMDITNEVVAALNKGHAMPAAPAPAVSLPGAAR